MFLLVDVLAALVLVLVSVPCLSARSYPVETSINLHEFLRIRCSLASDEQVITSWKGNVFLHLYQVEPYHLFDVVGMNVARCFYDQVNDQIVLTSRETQLYVDVNTGSKLVQWHNPFTGQTVPVMHVANDPVQNFIPVEQFSIEGFLTSDNQFVLPIDVNLFYPNPLFDNETLRFYSKEKFYQAGEYFKFFTTFDQVTNDKLSQVTQMDLSWTRVAPLLPWMNMSQAFTGSLTFSAQGSKVKSLDEISPVLFNEIVERIPIYRDAPTCQLNTTSETSWTYFKKHFDEYLSTTYEFPIPKSQEDIPCV
jgi:hypothetical protein